ncbi:MAG: energy transducer TonB [Flavobacteriaceae bacterium]|nr:energy transducer TonB [Flavobacteriaceae bacterium]
MKKTFLILSFLFILFYCKSQVKIMPEPKENVVEEETITPLPDNKVLGAENKEENETSGTTAPPVVSPSIFTYVDEEAKFKGGGLKEASEFIAKNMKYTKKAIKNETEGKILVRFVVEIDGSVSDIQVVGKKLGDGLDEIAINAVKETDKMWIPAKWEGQIVRSYFRIPITFRLPIPIRLPGVSK